MVESSVSPERCEMIVAYRRRCHAHGIERLGDGPNLIELDEQRVPDLVGDPSQNFRVRENTSSPTSCTRLPIAVVRSPAVPVALRKAVSIETIGSGESNLVQLNHLVRCAIGFSRFLEGVLAPPNQSSLSHVQRDEDVLRRLSARLSPIASSTTSTASRFDFRFCEAAFVADASPIVHGP